jgi:hypothetical protein
VGMKRKRSVKDCSDDNSDGEETSGGPILGPSNSHSMVVSARTASAASGSSHRPAVAPSTNHTPLPQPVLAVSNPSPSHDVVTPTRLHKITGLQHQENDLKTLVRHLVDGQEELCQDNLMLRGWFEVLRASGEKMMVDILVLEAEMSGIKFVMDLQKMHHERTRLELQLGQANARLAQLELESSSEGTAMANH